MTRITKPTLLSLFTVSVRIWLLGFVLLVAAVLVPLASMRPVPSHASVANCRVWYQCPITQHYGQNQEHGVDIWTQGKAITALLPGRVTSVYVAHWEWPYPTVITWQLTHPVCYRGHCADYMYVQIKNSSVWRGEHIVAGQRLGWSYSFIEIGFNDYPAYGAWPYPWRYSGIDPLRVWPWL